MLHNKDIFRRYDIRGVFGKNLTSDTAECSARAFATQVIKEKGDSHPKLSVGRDNRFSSKELAEAVIKGLTASGADVLDIGVCPSPLTYFSMYSEDTDGYVMITGSHNPPEFNGIKVGTKKTVYHSEKIEQIYRDIIAENYPVPDRPGTVSKGEIKTKYIRFMLDHFAPLKRDMEKLGRKIKIVIDAGSGTASDIAPVIFSGLGAEVYPLYCVSDGSFPGHHPDPTVEKNMAEAKALLLDKSADMAIGYDGDADRLGALDCKGEMVWGDQLIAVFAYDVAPDHKGAKVVADVKASLGLYELIESVGMEPVMYLSGHSMIKVKMKEVGAVIGGEMSSHFFFSDRYFGFDDGIYASLRLLGAYVGRLSRGEIETSCQLTSVMKKYPNTPEIRDYCPDSKKFEIILKLYDVFSVYKREGKLGIKDIIDIDGLRIVFEKGWALVRASNTEPLLVTRYEAVTTEEMERLRSIVKAEIDRIVNDK